jgi:hypothetical protein
MRRVMHTWKVQPEPEFVNPIVKAEREARAELKRREMEELAESFFQWRLSRLEWRLYLAILARRFSEDDDGNIITLETLVIARLYKVDIHKLPKRELDRFRARLRKIQERLNRKLIDAEAGWIDRPVGHGFLRLGKSPPSLKKPCSLEEIAYDKEARNPPPADQDELWRIAAKVRRETGSPMDVGECVARLGRILANGPVPFWEVRRQLEPLGCRFDKAGKSSTLKNARRHLGVISERQGYGPDGEWILKLPGQVVTGEPKPHPFENSLDNSRHSRSHSA